MNPLELRAMKTRWIRSLLLALSLISCSRGPEKAAPAVQARPVLSGGVLVREMAVTAQGFEPARVEVLAGQPVVLRITRKVAETCADAIDVQGDPVRHMLPLDRPVDVKVTAPPSGEIAFACPMKMIHGALVVVSR